MKFADVFLFFSRGVFRFELDIDPRLKPSKIRGYLCFRRSVCFGHAATDRKVVNWSSNCCRE